MGVLPRRTAVVVVVVSIYSDLDGTAVTFGRRRRRRLVIVYHVRRTLKRFQGRLAGVGRVTAPTVRKCSAAAVPRFHGLAGRFRENGRGRLTFADDGRRRRSIVSGGWLVRRALVRPVIFLLPRLSVVCTMSEDDGDRGGNDENR